MLVDVSNITILKAVKAEPKKAAPAKGTTKAHAKKLHKELPPGGQWVTMHGHHIYILNGKILAGAVPTAKGDALKKMDKKTIAEHQTAHTKAEKEKAKKEKEKAKKAKEKEKAAKAKEKEAKAKAGPKKAEPKKVEPKLTVSTKTAAPKKKASEAPKPAATPVKGEAKIGGKIRGGEAIDNGDGTVNFTFNGKHGGKSGTHTVTIPKDNFTPHASEAPKVEAVPNPLVKKKKEAAAKEAKKYEKPLAAMEQAKLKKPEPAPAPASPVQKLKYIEHSGMINDGTLQVTKTIDAEEAEPLGYMGHQMFVHNTPNGWKVSHLATGMAITQNYGKKDDAIAAAKKKVNNIGVSMKKLLRKAENQLGTINTHSPVVHPADPTAAAPEHNPTPAAIPKPKKQAKPKAPKAPKAAPASEVPEYVTAKHEGTADGKPKYNEAKNPEALPEMNGIQAFIHELPGGQWMVSEKTTGMSLGNALHTKEQAIQFANYKLGKSDMVDYLKNKIASTAQQHGTIADQKGNILPQLGSGAGDGSGKMTAAQAAFVEHAKKKIESAIMDKESISGGFNHATGYFTQDEKDALKQYHAEGNPFLGDTSTWTHLQPSLDNIKQIKADQAKKEAAEKKAKFAAQQASASAAQKAKYKDLYDHIEQHNTVSDPDKHYELFHGTAMVHVSDIIKNGFWMKGLDNDLGHCAYFKSPEFDSKEDAWGGDTKKVTDFFSKGAHIKAYVHKDHVLDLSKGVPQKLTEMKHEFAQEGMSKYGIGQKKMVLKYLAKQDITGLTHNEIETMYDSMKDTLPPHELGAFTHYEGYCKSNGYKGVVGVLPSYKSEGWQFGIYDPSIIKVQDWGRGVQNLGQGQVALMKSMNEKGYPPYALLNLTMDGDHYVLHVGVIDDTNDVEKSLFCMRNFMQW